ncbi:MAG: TlpA family protein disulfide reductase [bacterium]|nr:TlpA family protein disulfide reductase [bacterium]
MRESSSNRIVRTVAAVLFALALACACGSAQCGVLAQPTPAPEWKVAEWINGDPGKLDDLDGRVVIVEFFQLWCPGCDRFSIPLIQRWHDKYWGNDNVVIVSIHTVFEGHDVQTPDRLREFVREKGMLHPVGIDAYEKPGDKIPVTMTRYDTQGTPQIAIIDKQGLLVFNHFGSFDPVPVEFFLERLLKEEGPKKKPRKTTRPTGRSQSAGPKPEAKKPRTPSRRAEKNPDLSGSYQITLEQTLKNCGPKIPPVTVPATLSVYDDRIDARFEGEYLGFRRISLQYQKASGEFSTTMKQRVRERGGGSTIDLQLTGRLNASNDPPQLQYEFRLDKKGDSPDLNCLVQGQGAGTRSGP